MASLAWTVDGRHDVLGLVFCHGAWFYWEVCSVVGRDMQQDEFCHFIVFYFWGCCFVAGDLCKPMSIDQWLATYLTRGVCFLSPFA